MTKSKRVWREYVNEPLITIDKESLYFDMKDGWYWRSEEYQEYAGYWKTPGAAFDARFFGPLEWQEEEEIFV